MSNLFELDNNDLEKLDSNAAVKFMQRLLWSEAYRNDIPLSQIRITRNIFIPDGGIDSEVNNAFPLNEDLIKKGYTGYQIKTGKDFEPYIYNKIKNELFKKKPIKKENLGSMVKACLDKNGTYVLVCFGIDPTPDQIKKSKLHLQKIFEQCGYKKANLDVLTQSNILSFANFFPSIAYQIKNDLNKPFQTHKSWSLNGDIKKPLVKTSEYDIEIENFVSILRENKSVHLRVVDLAGSGKTRFVFEATKKEDIEPLTFYFKKPEDFKNGVLSNLLCTDNNYSLIAIIDECNTQQSIELWNQLKHRNSKVKLITIFNEDESKEYDVHYPNIPQLTPKETMLIIQNYQVPPDQAERYSILAGTSPRFAHMIGQNLSLYPEDILKPVEDIYNRIIAGYENPNSSDVKKRRMVLRYLALFKRFGYSSPHEKEAELIRKKISIDCNISKAEFEEIISKLKELKILQGEITLYITPLALHIKMWCEWWESYRRNFNLSDFLKDFPENSEIRYWFYEMFKYAEESNSAISIVNDLLGDNGPFHDGEYFKNQIGARFFLALAEANPKAALNCLKKTISNWSKKELLEFKSGRREIVWALGLIVVWGDLFEEGSKILLKLAEAENERYSNNATGIFCELFSPGRGRLAPTEISPIKRFPILLEILNSNSSATRLIAFEACKIALASQHFVRNIGSKFQGLKRKPNLWVPETYDEIYKYYEIVWNELNKRLDKLSKEEKTIGIDILFNSARGLSIIPSLSEIIINSFDSLSKKKYVNKKELLSHIVRIIHFEGKNLPKEVLLKWESLRDKISGNDYSSMLKRHVGMDLIEDDFNEKGEKINAAELKVKDLAQYSLKNKQKLKKELKWLITEEAKKGYLFGYHLGLEDKGLSLLKDFFLAYQRNWKKANAVLISGYFKAIFETNISKWEDELEKLSNDENLNKLVFEITDRTGLTDRALERLILLTKQNIIPIDNLRSLAYGSIIINVSLDIFNKLINLIIDSKNKNAGFISVYLCNHYFLTKENINKFDPELVYKVLIHKSFFHNYPPAIFDPMIEYYWTQLGKTLVNKYKHYSVKFGKILFKYFGVKGSILFDYFSQNQEVVNIITKDFPTESWDLISKYLGPPIDDRAFHIYNWLRGGDFNKAHQGTINLIPVQSIINWVDEDIERRAWYFATFVPPILFKEEDQTCYARQVLIKYGSRNDVRENLISNYSNEGWTGPSSLHYYNKKIELLNYKKSEDNKNVILWIDEYIAILDQRIRKSRIEEEREEY